MKDKLNQFFVQRAQANKEILQVNLPELNIQDQAKDLNRRIENITDSSTSLQGIEQGSTVLPTTNTTTINNSVPYLPKVELVRLNKWSLAQKATESSDLPTTGRDNNPLNSERISKSIERLNSKNSSKKLTGVQLQRVYKIKQEKMKSFVQR